MQVIPGEPSEKPPSRASRRHRLWSSRQEGRWQGQRHVQSHQPAFQQVLTTLLPIFFSVCGCTCNFASIAGSRAFPPGRLPGQAPRTGSAVTESKAWLVLGRASSTLSVRSQAFNFLQIIRIHLWSRRRPGQRPRLPQRPQSSAGAISYLSPWADACFYPGLDSRFATDLIVFALDVMIWLHLALQIGFVNNTDGGRSVLFPDYKQA